MTSLDDLVLGPLYANPFLAVDAVYTPVGGSPVTIRVQDRRQGVEQGPSDGPQGSTISPEIWVRRGDVVAAPVNGTLALDGVTYTIVSWRHRLNGTGVATGELRLMVRKS